MECMHMGPTFNLIETIFHITQGWEPEGTFGYLSWCIVRNKRIAVKRTIAITLRCLDGKNGATAASHPFHILSFTPVFVHVL